MKKNLLLTFCLIVFLTGCQPPPQSSVVFHGKHVVIGQTSESVEKLLGPPHEANKRPYLKAYKVGSMISPGFYTTEWIYWSQPKSLCLWLDNNVVQAIWHENTEWLKN